MKIARQQQSGGVASLLASLLLLVPGAVLAFNENATQLTLPTTVGEMTEVTSLPSGNSTGHPVLLPLTDESQLVTLNRVKRGHYVPVGRSYNGHIWESVAGPDSTVGYECGVDSEVSSDTLCETYLPLEDGVTYYLTAYEHTLTEKDEIARFLERTTFGVTRDELYDWNHTSSAEWVKEQMLEGGSSSHREYYRKRLNPRSIESYIYGVAGPKACSKNARYRKFAFTRKDLYMSKQEGKFHMEILPVNDTSNGEAFVLQIAGKPRTYVTEALQYYGTTDYVSNSGTADIAGTLDMSGEYEICVVEEIEGSRSEIEVDDARSFALMVGGKCSYIVGGNPTVKLDPTLYEMSTVLQLDMSSLNNETDIVVINEDFTLGSDLLLTVDVSDDACETFPDPTDNDFRDPKQDVPFAEDFYTGYEASKYTPDEPVFALLPDGTYAIHDYRLDIDENTLENPLADGGGSKVIAAAHGGDEQVYYCSNAPQTIFNEESCKISFEANTCTNFRQPVSKISSNTGTGTLVCGSEGEVAPDPYEDDHFDLMNRFLDSSPYYNQMKQTVWQLIALSAKDQLRQRVAWALSQIFIVAPQALYDPFNTETHLNFYDLFVRNAFANYRDVFKAVAYNPRMGQYLTYVGAGSIAYKWQAVRQMQHPDENFARECFQLFSIGLVKLNMDGSPQVDQYGVPIKTYDTKDIVSYARAWTGFWYNDRRGNYEELTWIHANFLDPMKIDTTRRDLFPKRGLDGKWIGDRMPLCTDLPERAFLRIGAKFKLLGTSSSPKWQEDDPLWDGDDIIKKFELDGSSNLYSALCAEVNNTCSYPSVVTLDANIECNGAECDVSTVRVVKVGNLFYEYIRVPCVQQAFYEGGKKIFSKWDNSVNMCGHPKMAVATEACCADDVYDYARRPCEYVGERVTFSTNEQRCESLGWHSCDASSVELPTLDDCKNHHGVNVYFADKNVYHWTTAECSLKVAVNNKGLAAIIHNPNKTKTVYSEEFLPGTSPHVDLENTMNYFSLYWPLNSTGDEQFPSIDNWCGEDACELTTGATGEDVCLCDTSVTNTAVFSSMPTRGEILSELTVGAFAIELFDDGDYVLIDSTDAVSAYRPADHSVFTTDTVFVVESEYGKTLHLKNVKSTVSIGGKYEIVNPPHFMDTVDPEARDAYYETEAVLDDYLYHENTPPFVSKKLIQRFGISNPSPRYISAVAHAFKEGSFDYTNGTETITFGDGDWGSLQATIAAILLDREATSVVLDADPSFGSVREPLLKVMGFMRSMNYTSTAPNSYPILNHGLSVKIGQMVYEAPDVFSFFSPDYVPLGGAFADASLVSPEAEVLNMVTTVGITNGLFNLIRHGLNACAYGFGAHIWGCQLRSAPGEYLPSANFNNSVGQLGYIPESETDQMGEAIVDELATLITSGRLSDANRQTIMEAYNATYTTEGPDVALQIAQQMIITTPEFHTTNLIRKTGNMRDLTVTQQNSNGEAYKALIYVFMFGGMDSFYMLAPATSCALYEEYALARGEYGKLDEQNMVVISSKQSKDEQPCEEFGINKQLSALKTIYNDGVGAFVANAGHLAKPVSRYNYFTETKTQLFSHSSMEQEAYAMDANRVATGTGVLGRMLDILQQNNFDVGSYGIDQTSMILDGDPDLIRSIDIIRREGVQWFYDTLHEVSEQLDADRMKDYFQSLNGETDLNSGLFGNHWSQEFVDTTSKSDGLGAYIENTALSVSGDWGGDLGTQLQMVSKLIKIRDEREKNRDVFYIRVGGFDTHFQMKDTLDIYKYPDINDGIDKFYTEMKSQGTLDMITFILASEFGRTIAPNTGKGTDHAWGGNYFVFGGEVNGGKILGQYPSSFLESDPTNDGRGRLIPSTPWDAIWNGVGQWFGIADEDLDYALPNRDAFGCRLMTDKDLYVEGVNKIEGCDGQALLFQQQLLLSEASYLSGDEQLAFCQQLAAYVSRAASNSKVRCVIVGQEVQMVTRRTRRGLQEQASLNVGVQFTSDYYGYGQAAFDLMDAEKDTIASDLTETKEQVTGLEVEGFVPEFTGIKNGKFEEKPEFDGWVVTQSGYKSVTMKKTGTRKDRDYHASFHSGTHGRYGGAIEQTVGFVPSESYQLSFSHGKNKNATGLARFDITVVDQDGNTLLSESVTDDAETDDVDWINEVFMFNTLSTTSYAVIKFTDNTESGGGQYDYYADGFAYWLDNIHVTEFVGIMATVKTGSVSGSGSTGCVRMDVFPTRGSHVSRDMCDLPSAGATKDYYIPTSDFGSDIANVRLESTNSDAWFVEEVNTRLNRETKAWISSGIWLNGDATDITNPTEFDYWQLSVDATPEKIYFADVIDGSFEDSFDHWTAVQSGDNSILITSDDSLASDGSKFANFHSNGALVGGSVVQQISVLPSASYWLNIQHGKGNSGSGVGGLQVTIVDQTGETLLDETISDDTEEDGIIWSDQSISFSSQPTSLQATITFTDVSTGEVADYDYYLDMVEVTMTECLAASPSTTDPGYIDAYRGWYDVQGCGQCNDYCRWVGNSGSGGDPADQLVRDSSFWSCRLAGTEGTYTPQDHFTSFDHLKCSGKGAITPTPEPTATPTTPPTKAPGSSDSTTNSTWTGQFTQYEATSQTVINSYNAFWNDISDTDGWTKVCIGNPDNKVCCDNPNEVIRKYKGTSTQGQFACGNHYWNVGGCGSGPSISAFPSDYGYYCSCRGSGAYTIRPLIGTNNYNWGGVGKECSAESQTLMISFEKPGAYLALYGPDVTSSAGYDLTYAGAEQFCSDRAGSLATLAQWCSAGGEGADAIYGGQKEGDQWAPVLDTTNEWVQIGERGDNDECKTHSEIMGYKPNWGITGASGDSIWQYILCYIEP